MDKQIIFKTSTIGGFEKRAVLDYIYALNEDNSAAQTQLREQIAGYASQSASQAETLRQTAEQLALAQKELEGIRADLVRERSRAVDLDSAGEILQGEVARQRERIAQMQGENDRLKIETNMLRDENSGMKERQGKIDLEIMGAGKLMFDARTDAANILSQARLEAQEIADTARAQAEEEAAQNLAEARSVREEAESRSSACIENAQAEARQILGEANRKAELLLKQSIISTDGAYEELQAFKGEISDIQGLVLNLLSSVESSGLGLLKIKDTITNQELFDAPEFPESLESSNIPGGESPDDFFREAASVQ